MTASAIAMPALIAGHGFWSRYERASASIEPQSGSGGCCPRPRKDSAAMSRIAYARSIVDWTTTAATRFGQDVAEHDPPVGVAERASRVDVGEPRVHERHRPHEARHRRHVDDAERDDDRPEPAAERRDDEDREQQRREREQRVQDPHDREVRAAAVEAGDQPESGSRSRR